jgi:hypothetical protein
MIFSEAYIETRIMLCASLADNNISGFDCLAAEKLHSQAFTL